MAAAISTAEWISLGLTAVGTVATVYFVANQTQQAKAAATTAQQASTSSQQVNQQTRDMLRRFPTTTATGLGW